MRRGSERKAPHIGTETRAKLLREAAVRGGSLNQPSRVREGGTKCCKPLFPGDNGLHAWGREGTRGISIG